MKKYRRYRNNDYDDEAIGLIAFVLIILFFQYWKFIIILLAIIVLCKLFIWVYDQDWFSKFHENKIYYQGENGMKKIKQLEDKNAMGEKNQYQINCFKKGIYGESRILYNLSQIDQIPMYIMHDVMVNYEGRKAQVDFIVVTKKSIYLIETKNLQGNIDIENDGTVTRIIGRNKKGMKNPFTQSNEHEKVINAILRKEKLKDKITSLVVLANDDNYVRFKKEAGKYKNKMIRNDQLEENLIKREDKKHIIRQETKIKAICDAILKYQIENFDTEEKMIESLKQYRKEISTKENIPAYMVYKDETILDLVRKCPSSIEELNGIIGLGDYKIQKYGETIIDIINNQQ